MTHDDTGGGSPALRTAGLGKRYGHVWGLRDCSLTVPAGAIVGLVGPNGAGKTTLLEMIIGLLKPTEGQIEVFGHTAQAGTVQTLARVGYVAQDHPLYPDFSVADMFHLGQAMNPNWDMGMAVARMEALDIPLKRKVKALSGGQQAQVSLAMALAKRAPLLVLDEPVASLDPVARAADPGCRPARHPHPPHRQRPALLRAAPHQPGRAGCPGTPRLADRERWFRAPGPGIPATPRHGRELQQPRPGRPAARADREGDVTMIWVSWRQHRSQAIVGLGLICAFAVYGLVLGLQMRTSFSNNNLATCLAHSLGAGCLNSVANFDNRFGSLVNIGFYAVLLLLPGLIGAVVGATVLGRELEMGTWRLAWSQTVPRTR